MKVIKNLLNNLLHFICKLYGYDLKAEQAKTEEIIKQAEVEIAEAKAETARVEEESAERIAELNAIDAHHQKCHEVYLAILELCQKHNYNHLEAQHAHSIQDLAALEHILDDMINQRYGYEVTDELPRAPKGPKVKRMRKSKG